MERDKRFEIQYLLSLIIAVIGAISSNHLQNYLDVEVAHFLLILLFFHLSFFNIVYSFSIISDFKIDMVEKMEICLYYTLLGITATFLFLVFHMIGIVLFDMATNCDPNLNIYSDLSNGYSTCGRDKIVISYVVPTVVVTALAAGVVKGMVPTINLFKDMKFIVSPSSTRVFYDFGDTEPILAKVENHSDSRQSFEVEVNLPEGVEAKCNGIKKETSFTKSLSVDANRQAKLDLQFRYRGTERRRDVIDISLIHEKGRKSEQVDVLLVS